MAQYWNLQTRLQDETNNLGNADIEGYGQISVLLSKYVLKEKGKGLSSNDFTDIYKNKLDSIESGAQKNVLETISINHGNPIIADDEKNININIPTKVSELQNDLSYAKLISASEYSDYSDSYVGKSKISFKDETDIPIGKSTIATNNGVAIGNGAIADNGIAIGNHATTSSTYDVNINNQAKHNKSTSLWEMKTTNSASADIAITNSNGTNLNQLDTVINGLSNEITNRNNADNTLQSNINGVSGRLTTVESYIPNQASSSNQLADKSFVNSSIQTNTANFRGSWSTWTDVPTIATDYPSDYSGSKTPTVNDYMIVQNASDYSLETLSGTWRFKYTSVWDTDGKNGWIPEYQVNEEPLTSEQVYAINSGITSTKVTNYDNHLSNTNNPHSVTASQIGLGNVTNVATESIITENSTNNITSGAVYTALGLKMNADVTHLSGDVPTSRTINGYDLSQDRNLTASDVGAIANTQVNTVTDNGYVPAPTSTNANKVWKTDENGNPNWRDEASANAVLLSGNQTISDTKTFTSPIIGNLQGISDRTKSLNKEIEISTTASNADKTADLEGFELIKHSKLIIYVSVANTATSALTLSINNTTAKTIVLNGEITSATNYNLAVGYYNAYYDGIYWILDSQYDSYQSRHSGTVISHTLYL